MPVLITVITLVTITASKLFLVNFVFTTEYIAPISTRKLISFFPTENYTWGSTGEIVISWKVSRLYLPTLLDLPTFRFHLSF